MSLTNVLTYLEQFNLRDAVHIYDTPSGTVAEAAATIGVEQDDIAKTVSFEDADTHRVILVVTEGNAKISSGKFKRKFGFKPHLIQASDVERLTGHPIGGVCPFANPEGVLVYLDNTLKKHEFVYPACGSLNSALQILPDLLYDVSGALEWVDVCQDREVI